MKVYEVTSFNLSEDEGFHDHRDTNCVTNVVRAADHISAARVAFRYYKTSVTARVHRMVGPRDNQSGMYHPSTTYKWYRKLKRSVKPMN